MTPNRNKIVLIGAGNLATQLGLALKAKGFPIAQVYSRTLESAESLAMKLRANFTTDLKEIIPDASLYIFSIKDSALEEVLQNLPSLSGLYVHTAGSLPMNVFAPYHSRYGVFYPLQTFNKERDVHFDHIPFFVEANNPGDENLLKELASTLSDTVIRLDSEKRKYLHLAAVFANNFTNHLYAQASDILEDQGIPREVLFPLIQETVDKIKSMTPREAQTGPAVRYDTNVIEKHLQLLEGDLRKQEIYDLLSRSIYELTKNDD
ncbi:DUF2520 domain-containing protein [Bacteroidales bacterium OttesenSCG-928-A17]|nr:DUF2520 domain-containing protein [Bacteroidales bacterium OttesenSCG-928-A17]